jgi:hypothetical protein
VIEIHQFVSLVPGFTTALMSAFVAVMLKGAISRTAGLAARTSIGLAAKIEIKRRIKAAADMATYLEVIYDRLVCLLTRYS